MPGVYFYKYLARKPKENGNESNLNRLKLWIPDTIICNEKELPNMWIYSSSEGYVYRTDTFNEKGTIHKLSQYCSKDELVVVVKKAHYFEGEFDGNDLKLVSKRDLPNVLNTGLSSRGEVVVFQRFIKANGPKPFIVRTCWRKNKNSYSYIITNKKDYYCEDDT